MGAGDMVQQLKALAVHAENWVLFPATTGQITNNPPLLQFQKIQCPFLASKDTAHMVVLKIHAGKTPINIKMN